LQISDFRYRWTITKNIIGQRRIWIDSKKRTIYDLSIDDATASDTLKDADFSSAEVVYPLKENQAAIKIQLKKETLTLCKQIADLKHIDNFMELIDEYIRNGIDKNKKILEKV
jgi:hypothetical protein